jgi:hypothetical protein
MRWLKYNTRFYEDGALAERNGKAESRKYSDKSLIQCHFVYHKSYILAWDRTQASVVTGWRLPA